MISCYLGVTEPAMFGINLKYVYPFVAGMIGSAMAGMFATLMGVQRQVSASVACQEFYLLCHNITCRF